MWYTCKAEMQILNILPIFYTVCTFFTFRLQTGKGVIRSVYPSDPHVNDWTELELRSEEKKTTEGVVARGIIIDQPVCLELHVYILLLPMSLLSEPVVSHTDVRRTPLFCRLTAELATGFRLLNMENRKKYIPLTIAVKMPVQIGTIGHHELSRNPLKDTTFQRVVAIASVGEDFLIQQWGCCCERSCFQTQHL